MSTEQRDMTKQDTPQAVAVPIPAAQRTISVKVVKLGAEPTVVQLAPGDLTLKTALEGFSTSGLNVRVNGRKVSDDYKLEEQDIITLLPQIRGGAHGYTH